MPTEAQPLKEVVKVVKKLVVSVFLYESLEAVIALYNLRYIRFAMKKSILWRVYNFAFKKFPILYKNFRGTHASVNISNLF